MDNEQYLDFVYYYQRHTKVWDILWNKEISNHFTVTDVYLLELLDKKAPITSGFIAEELNLTSGGVTGLIHRLEQKHLINKHKDPYDKRINYISMTVEGKEALIHLRKECTKLTKCFLSVLSLDEIRQLEQLNKKIFDSYQSFRG